MATSIEGAFASLKQRLEITDLQGSVVSTRQTKIREVVSNGLETLDSFLTGSYSRSTLIAPLSEADIDVFVVLDPKYFYQYNDGKNGGQAGLLDAVKRTLRRTYTRTPDIARSGQAVTIRFEDFLVDVVPGFNRNGGGYLIANSITQSWISTNPKRHVEISAAANSAHNGDLVPLIKMIKAWNKGLDQYFRSFHLEVLAWAMLDGVEISDFPSGVRFFFDKARDLVTKTNPDPAGYGGDVGNYLNTSEKVQTAVTKLQTAYDRALKAEDFARRGFRRDAVAMWQSVFGEYFPPYGWEFRTLEAAQHARAGCFPKQGGNNQRS
jgi:Second Messenger Oligonucleotide or Dinucleotide Synthetase domain